MDMNQLTERGSIGEASSNTSKKPPIQLLVEHWKGKFTEQVKNLDILDLFLNVTFITILLAIDLDARKNELDLQAQEITDNKDANVTHRKKLAEETKSNRG
jgi:hypothetical protein